MSNKIQKYQAKLQKAIASNDFDRRDMYRMKLEQYQSQNGGMQFGGVLDDKYKKKIDAVNNFILQLKESKEKLESNLAELQKQSGDLTGQCEKNSTIITALTEELRVAKETSATDKEKLDKLNAQILQLTYASGNMQEDINQLQKMIDSIQVNQEDIKSNVATSP
jgi:chromosome segregation ATPase